MAAAEQVHHDTMHQHYANLTNYAHVHLTLYADVLPMMQILFYLFLTIVLIMVVAIPALKRM